MAEQETERDALRLDQLLSLGHRLKDAGCIAQGKEFEALLAIGAWLKEQESHDG